MENDTDIILISDSDEEIRRRSDSPDLLSIGQGELDHEGASKKKKRKKKKKKKKAPKKKRRPRKRKRVDVDSNAGFKVNTRPQFNGLSAFSMKEDGQSESSSIPSVQQAFLPFQGQGPQGQIAQFIDPSKRKKTNKKVAVFWDIENLSFFDVDVRLCQDYFSKLGSLEQRHEFFLSKLSKFIERLGPKRHKLIPQCEDKNIQVINVPTWGNHGTIKEAVDMKMLMDMTFWWTGIMTSHREKQKRKRESASKSFKLLNTLPEEPYIATVVLISSDNDYTFLLSQMKMSGLKVILLGAHEKRTRIELLQSASETYSFEKDVICGEKV